MNLLKKTKFSKFIIIIAFLIVFVQFSIAEEQSNKLPLGKGEIEFNPLGFLQFGPIIHGAFRVGDNVFLGAHYRISSMGLLYWMIETDLFEDEVNLNSGGIGVDFRYFFDNKQSPHRFYVGGIVEKGWGGLTGEDDVGEWESKTDYYVVAGNAGYRFRFSSGFFMNLGGYAGFSKDTKSELWYDNSSSVIRENPLETTIFLMLEFALGMEFH